jgi:hypothetical protein
VSTTTTTPPDAIAERFALETEHHKLTILHDEGLYRHLRFMCEPDGKPKRSAYWFDLITVPGALIFQGDGDSFVFRRLEDMFAFFRSNPDRNVARINPHYWSEKLTSGRDAVKTYSREKFDQRVAEELKDAEERFPGITDAWTLHADEFNGYYLDDEGSARQALNDFEYTADGRDDTFRFTDTWEWDLKDYDWWFLWACHGIVWGIAQYDATKAKSAAAREAVAVNG